MKGYKGSGDANTVHYLWLLPIKLLMETRE